jgi:DNA-binding NtrC family response regulator
LNKRFENNVLETFQKYQWPGNIRELKNAVERLVVISKENELRLSDLQFSGQKIYAPTISEDFSFTLNKLVPLNHVIQTVEQQILARAKEELSTNRRIADALKVSHATICRKLGKYKQ